MVLRRKAQWSARTSAAAFLVIVIVFGLGGAAGAHSLSSTESSFWNFGGYCYTMRQTIIDNSPNVAQITGTTYANYEGCATRRNVPADYIRARVELVKLGSGVCSSPIGWTSNSANTSFTSYNWSLVVQCGSGNYYAYGTHWGVYYPSYRQGNGSSPSHGF